MVKRKLSAVMKVGYGILGRRTRENNIFINNHSELYYVDWCIQ